MPCIEYHIPEARKAGLSEPLIQEAVQLADQVRQVPARKVLAAAERQLAEAAATTTSEQSGGGCGQPVFDSRAEQPCCS